MLSKMIFRSKFEEKQKMHTLAIVLLTFLLIGASHAIVRNVICTGTEGDAELINNATKVSTVG